MDAGTSRYHEVYARWQRDPQGFWGEAAQDIDWIEPPRQVFNPEAGVYGRWFAGGHRINPLPHLRQWDKNSGGPETEPSNNKQRQRPLFYSAGD